jgi:predicted dinucleotide-binding enzyme
MKIAVLGAGRVGSTVGRLWHAAGHDVTFAARHATRPRALAAELGERAHAASVAAAVTAAEVVLVAVPGPAVTDTLQAAGPLDGRIVIDAANSLESGVFGQHQLSLRSRVDAFPRARWVRAFNSLSVSVMADDNHREPPWVLFLSGDEEAKPAVAQLIRDAGFDPVDLGGIDDSQLQDPGSALWTYTLTRDEATALVARIKSGNTAAADPLTAPFEKFRDHAPEDPAFFLEHLSRGLRGGALAGRPGQVGRHPGGVPRLRPGAGRRHDAGRDRGHGKRRPGDPQQGEDPRDGAERAGASAPISRRSRTRTRPPRTCGGALSSSATPGCGGS